LANLQGYIDDLSRVSPNVPLIVAANKLDLVEEHQLTAQQISDWAKDLGISLYQTSAKTGDNVDTLFQDLGQKLVK
jgi:putative ribosome biogenesis GTPase RsgA